MVGDNLSKHRLDRISEEIKKEISDILRQGIKDPRVSAMSSIVDVKTTPDLRFAKVFVSVLGDEKQKQDTVKGLKSAAGYIRRELADRIDLRYTPELVFELDISIEHGASINKILGEIKKKEDDAKIDVLPNNEED